MRGQERRLTSSKITELMEYWSDRTFTMMGTMVIITIPTIPIATVRASLMCLVVMHLRQTHERPRRCPRRIRRRLRPTAKNLPLRCGTRMETGGMAIFFTLEISRLVWTTT